MKTGRRNKQYNLCFGTEPTSTEDKENIRQTLRMDILESSYHYGPLIPGTASKPYHIFTVGKPIARSLSPRLHSSLFAPAGTSWTFHLAETTSGAEPTNWVSTPDSIGMFITTPNKVALQPFFQRRILLQARSLTILRIRGRFYARGSTRILQKKKGILVDMCHMPSPKMKLLATAHREGWQTIGCIEVLVRFCTTQQVLWTEQNRLEKVRRRCFNNRNLSQYIRLHQLHLTIHRDCVRTPR